MILDTAALSEYRSRYPHEHKTVSIVESHLDQLQRDKQIAQTNGHATGSAWVFNPNNGKVLLTLHKKLNRWLQLGGHMQVEDNDTIIQTALREAKEESGIPEIKLTHNKLFHLDIHYIPPYRNEPEHYHYDFCFLHHITNDDNTVITQESIDLKWFSLAELMQMDLEASIRKMCKKWQQHLFETSVEYTDQ